MPRKAAVKRKVAETVRRRSKRNKLPSESSETENPDETFDSETIENITSELDNLEESKLDESLEESEIGEKTLNEEQAKDVGEFDENVQDSLINDSTAAENEEDEYKSEASGIVACDTGENNSQVEAISLMNKKITINLSKHRILSPVKSSTAESSVVEFSPLKSSSIKLKRRIQENFQDEDGDGAKVKDVEHSYDSGDVDDDLNKKIELTQENQSQDEILEVPEEGVEVKSSESQIEEKTDLDDSPIASREEATGVEKSVRVVSSCVELEEICDKLVDEENVEVVSIEETDGDGVSIDEKNVEGVSNDETNADVSVDETNLVGVSKDKANADVSVDETNLECVSIYETDGEGISMDESNVEGVSKGERNAVDVSMDETNVEDLSIDKTNVESVSIDDTDREGISINETNVENVPIDETNAAVSINETEFLSGNVYQKIADFSEQMEAYGSIEIDTTNSSDKVEKSIEDDLTKDKDRVSQSEKESDLSPMDTITTETQKEKTGNDKPKEAENEIELRSEIFDCQSEGVEEEDKMELLYEGESLAGSDIESEAYSAIKSPTKNKDRGNAKSSTGRRDSDVLDNEISAGIQEVPIEDLRNVIEVIDLDDDEDESEKKNTKPKSKKSYSEIKEKMKDPIEIRESFVDPLKDVLIQVKTSLIAISAKQKSGEKPSLEFLKYIDDNMKKLIESVEEQTSKVYSFASQNDAVNNTALEEALRPDLKGNTAEEMMTELTNGILLVHTALEHLKTTVDQKTVLFKRS